MKKILFIYPETYLNIGIPGGIAIMSALLKQRNHKVDLFDTAFLKTEDYAKTEEVHGGVGLSDKGGVCMHKKTEYTLQDLVLDDPVVDLKEELQKKIDSFNPDIIALSCMTSNFDFACDLTKTIKHNAIVVVGGVHATIAYKDCLDQDFVDYAFVGEGDRGMLDLVEALEKKEDVTKVQGLAYKNSNGEYINNKVGPRVCLDDLPCPDWGLFDDRHLFRPYQGKIYKGSFYSQSRGCPMQCKYCVDPTEAAITGGPAGYFRVQKPEVTIAHLTELKEKYGATWYKFSDDTFLLPKVDHLKELSAGFKKLGIQFACSVMINTITEEKVALAADMGCVSMSIGIEAGNPKIREGLNRRYSDEKLQKGIGWMHKYGIKVSSFNIIGCPGETRENVFETIELNRKLKVSSCNVYIMFPYPGTPIQIESKLPIRDKDGKLFKVSEAKNLAIPKTTPDELEGMYKNFNIYLYLPKSLWPVVELAEKRENWGEMFNKLKSLSVEFLSDQIEEIELDENQTKIISNKIPKRLHDIYVDSTGRNKTIILNSINSYLEEKKVLNISLKKPSLQTIAN